MKPDEEARRRSTWKRWLGRVALALVAILLLIQLVPYGRDHSNPPVQNQADIANPEARVLWNRACADCHSNLTKWPWYSNVAPISWRVQSHVEEGRAHFNLSEWQTSEQPDIKEIRDQVESGEMPTWDYKLIHGGLSDREARVLVNALTRAWRADPPARSGG